MKKRIGSFMLCVILATAIVLGTFVPVSGAIEPGAEYSIVEDFSTVNQGPEWYYGYAPFLSNYFSQYDKTYDFEGDLYWANGSDDWSLGAISEELIAPGEVCDAILAFKAPVTGSITLSMTGGRIERPMVWEPGSDGAYVKIQSNKGGTTTDIWPTDKEWQYLSHENSAQSRVNFSPMTFNVRKGEYLYFRASMGQNNWSDEVIMAPVIKYNTIDPNDEGYSDDTDGDNSSRLPEFVDNFDRSTIQDGNVLINYLNANQSSDIITLPPGVYDFTGDLRLQLSSQFSNKTIISDGVLMLIDHSDPTAVVLNNVSNTLFRGLTIDEKVTSGGSSHRVVVFGGKNLILRDFTVLGSGNGAGIHVTGDSDGVTVDRLTVNPNISIGVLIDDGLLVDVNPVNTSVTNSVFKNSVCGVSCRNTTNTVITGNVFADSAHAVYSLLTKHLAVVFNEFKGGNVPVHLQNTQIAIVNDNTWVGNGNPVLNVENSSSQIVGNEIPGEQDGNPSLVGADVSKLPQIDRNRFKDMPRKTSINGQSVYEYIMTAYKSGRGLVIIPPGAYSIAAPPFAAHLSFANMKDFTIYAYGVFFEFEHYNGTAFAFTKCENISLLGLTMDYKQPGNLQGKITAIDGSRVIWTADAGYVQDLLDESLVEYEDGVESAAEAFRPGSDIPYADIYYNKWEIQKVSDGVYSFPQRSSLTVGSKVIFRGRFAHINKMNNCSGMEYEDVTVFGGSGYGFLEENGEGNSRLNRVAFTPGPVPAGGTEERLISTCDATHAVNMRVGMKVTNCLAEKMTDDATNNCGTYGRVTGFNTTTRVLTYTEGNQFRVGDRALVYTQQGKLLCDATVTAVNGRSLTLNKTFTLESNAIIENGSANGNGFLYENCVIQNNRSRGFLIKSPYGTIKNCTLKDNGMSAILIAPEVADNWGECGFSWDINIINNRFIDGGFFSGSELHSPVNITGDSFPREDQAYYNHANILIQGNSFEGRYTRYCINANSVKGLRIIENTFGNTNPGAPSGVSSLQNKQPVINVQGAMDIEVSYNIYPGSIAGDKVNIGQYVTNIFGTDLGTGEPKPPSAPLLVSASPGNGKVTLGWDSATGAVSYTVYRSTTSGGPYTQVQSNIVGNSFTVTGLTNNVTYYFVVRAVNPIGTSGNSNQLSATPVLDPPTPPTTPVNLRAVNVDKTSLTLNWNAATHSSGIKEYDIYRNGAKVAEVAGNVTGYNDSGLQPDTEYTYAVKARSNKDTESALSPELKVRTLKNLEVRYIIEDYTRSDSLTKNNTGGASIYQNASSITNNVLQWNGAWARLDFASGKLSNSKYLVFRVKAGAGSNHLSEINLTIGGVTKTLSAFTTDTINSASFTDLVINLAANGVSNTSGWSYMEMTRWGSGEWNVLIDSIYLADDGAPITTTTAQTTTTTSTTAAPATTQSDDPDCVIMRIDHLYAAVNGKKVRVNDLQELTPIFNEGGRTMVPFRFIATCFGAEVDWDEGAGSAVIDYQGKHIVIPIDKSFAYVDGVQTPINAPAQIMTFGRTFVPFRAVSELLGGINLEYDPGTLTIIASEGEIDVAKCVAEYNELIK